VAKNQHTSSLVSFSQARALVKKHSPLGKIISLPLLESLHFVLAENVFSKSDSPPFDQSAMDGYAFNFKTWDKKVPFKISGIIPAGKSASTRLKRNEAAQIFTGAQIPQGADCVVMKEKVSVEDSNLWIHDLALKIGSNIRIKSSHVKSGKVVLKKGDLISAGSIAFLASIGIEKVKVFAKPRIGIVVTGDELIAPGIKLKPGQVYECNSFGLSAALKLHGIVPEIVLHAKDSVVDVRKKLLLVEKNCDIVIFTGGVSVGDFDFVASSLLSHSVTQHFHKVKQKPGKPIFFGSKKNKLYFGLPGNPASVLVCFHVYVVDAIQKFAGSKMQNFIEVPLLNSFSKKAGLTNILKARYNPKGVGILYDQESYKLNAFADANCLVVLGEEITMANRGDSIKILEIKN